MVDATQRSKLAVNEQRVGPIRRLADTEPQAQGAACGWTKKLNKGPDDTQLTEVTLTARRDPCVL